MNHFSHFFKAEMSNNGVLQLLKCRDLGIFFVDYDGKQEALDFGQKTGFEDMTFVQCFDISLTKLGPGSTVLK